MKSRDIQNAQTQMWPQIVYEMVNQKKTTHWSWYMFPNIKGLGSSPMAQKYAIDNRKEWKLAANNPVIIGRIETVCLILEANHSDPEDVLGEIDSLKLKSCLTLFRPYSAILKSSLKNLYNNSVCEKTDKQVTAWLAE